MPAATFPSWAWHLRRQPCNFYLLWLCPPHNQSCALGLPVVICGFWAPFNSRTSQCLSVTGVQAVAPICTCAEVYSVRSWILPRTETTQPLWTACSNAWLVNKFILMSSWSLSCFNLSFCLSPFCRAMLRRTWSHVLDNSPQMSWKAAVRSSQAHLFSRLNKPTYISISSPCCSSLTIQAEDNPITTTLWNQLSNHFVLPITSIHQCHFSLR